MLNTIDDFEIIKKERKEPGFVAQDEVIADPLIDSYQEPEQTAVDGRGTKRPGNGSIGLRVHRESDGDKRPERSSLQWPCTCR